MNESTLGKMRKMKLFGMYRAFKTNLEDNTGEALLSMKSLHTSQMQNGMKDRAAP